ncbi:TerB family tellurite resistance protein [Lichenifustis flavocetrariae]|uniref:TerB family tellurite resistance protein n=1 Tax=Lichenifustis flavocetrariae TaxID=2949735 RepID=A0AA41YSI3_9HYPH|nr:TerB family tellurite resistance protein [Lichenifustis flavocetrariae]MCW6506510.1 TerB family tellurite resistance protein [Lichenifustis flavocetrariae]
MYTSSSNVRPESPRDAPTAPAEMLLDALVAAYALMAHADGELASAERRRLFAIIRDTPALEVFSRDDVAHAAAEHEANFRLDPEVAQQLAWEKIDPIVGQRRAAHVLIAACRELIPADGVAHPAEYRALADIKSRLGVDDLPPHA